MFGSLRGKILDKNPPEILIEVNGVGYEVLMPISNCCNLPEENQEVFVYTSLIVREDAQTLYGFLTKEEKILFRELVKVSGIGPKTALAILSTMKPIEFVNAVKGERANELIKVPGIGKRGAERILVEIKDKVQGFGITDSGSSEPTFAVIEEDKEPQGNIEFVKNIEEQAVDAFIGLGYNAKQASLLVHKHYKEGMNVEEIIKAVLQSL